MQVMKHEEIVALCRNMGAAFMSGYEDEFNGSGYRKRPTDEQLGAAYDMGVQLHKSEQREEARVERLRIG